MTHLRFIAAQTFTGLVVTESMSVDGVCPCGHVLQVYNNNIIFLSTDKRT